MGIDCRTLHIRLTNHCNADCSYCSSYSNNPSKMSSADVIKSSKFILENIYKDIIPLKGESHLAIQYVGGELLTLNMDELKYITESVYDIFESTFDTVVYGAQSNLIGSKNKVNKLIDIFGKRIGTSDEFNTKERTVKGSSDLYQNIYKKNLLTLKSYGIRPGVVYVLDEKSKDGSLDFYIKNKFKYSSIIYRPIFNNGTDGLTLSNKSLMDTIYNLFNEWFMVGNIHVEPFSMLLSNIFNHSMKRESCLGCPFQSNCIEKSLDLESNGDLFICFDTADADILKLGNALDKEIDIDLINKLKKRKYYIKDACEDCPAFKVCHGGCLSESVTNGFGMYDKTPYCETWKELIQFITEQVSKYGIHESKDWFNKLQ